MNIIIEIYIFVCIMLLLFDIVFLISKNFKNRKLYIRKNKIKDMVHQELENYEVQFGLSNNLKDFLENRIKKTKNLIIFNNELDQIKNNKENLKNEILPYILRQIENYQNKSNYEQAYYAYVISSFDYREGELDQRFYEMFLRFLDSKSLYVFSNTMDAIYKFSDSYLMIEAIKKSDKRNGFYHSKLLIDGLLDFKGDTNTLHSLIINKFYKYSALTQKSLLDYFRLKGSNVKDFCIDIIRNQIVEDEVLYAAMRYFIKYPDDRAKSIAMDFLKDDEGFWVKHLLSIKVLNNYDEFLVKEAIKRKVTSKNWHVRTSAISYLHDNTLSKGEIYSILSLDDKYANESLLYSYKDDKEISEYIIDTLEDINKEKNKNQESEDPLTVGISG